LRAFFALFAWSAGHALARVIAMTATYDAIVVGARCAGAPTAMLLAQAGARVLLVDRASFPSDTVSGHAIKPAGVAYLQRWGLLERLLMTGCPPIREAHASVAGRLVPQPPEASGRLPFLAPRRTVLDALLVDAAAAAGADVRERTSVVGLVRSGEQVIGVEARSTQGPPMRALAPIVIGADGKQSWVASQVRAEYTSYQSPVSIAYYTYWSGCHVDRLELHFGAGRLVGIIPTNDAQVLAFVQCRWEDRHAFRANVVGSYLAGLHAFPSVVDALAGGTYDEAIRGMLDLPTYFRQSYGPGWALAGDAAHHKDPLIARGISDAFRDADLLARAVATGLGGKNDLRPALGRYQVQREAASRTVSRLTHRLAELPDDPREIEERFGQLTRAEAAADAQTAQRSA
jgi:flavin-dependent dehydrogenase